MTWRIDLPGAGKIFWREVAVRLVIITLFIITENLAPFYRVIQPEEIWLYRYPSRPDYVTSIAVYVYIVCCCLAVIGCFYIINRNLRESWEAILVASFAIPMNGLITNLIKLSVGRPRPDYFQRCFPGQPTFDITQPCTGDQNKLDEGRKSFPSGHSSNMFSSMVFVSLYVAGKLGTFNSRGRGQGWRLVVTVAPLILALLVAISRTADYHHHWQDVTVGGILGALVSFTVYRQHYPSVTSDFSGLPFSVLQNLDDNSFATYRPLSQNSNLTPLIKHV